MHRKATNIANDHARDPQLEMAPKVGRGPDLHHEDIKAIDALNAETLELGMMIERPMGRDTMMKWRWISRKMPMKMNLRL